MNWYAESHTTWMIRMKKWHKHFALIPVWSAIEERAYWLEMVERRLYLYSEYSGDAWYEYRGIK